MVRAAMDATSTVGLSRYRTRPVMQPARTHTRTRKRMRTWAWCVSNEGQHGPENTLKERGLGGGGGCCLHLNWVGGRDPLRVQDSTAPTAARTLLLDDKCLIVGVCREVHEAVADAKVAQLNCSHVVMWGKRMQMERVNDYTDRVGPADSSS